MSNQKKLIDFEDSFFVAGHKVMVGSAVCRALRKKGYEKIITCDKKNLN